MHSRCAFACQLLFFFVLSASVVGCSDDGVQTPPEAAIPWEDCGGGFECAQFEVPFDHDAPDGRTFSLPLVRRPAKSPDARIGSLLVNPGGPGGSGKAWVLGAWLVVPSAILDRFDLVGFDPRGQAGSTPSIDCIDDLGPFVGMDLTPADSVELQLIESETAALVEGCNARSGELLPFVGTDNIVRDMDLLREALGDDKLTYLGFSYGTFLGTMYANAYPDRVRALVLDAALDPTLDGAAFIEGQARGFEAELEAFLADCAAKTTCPFHSGGDPGAAYDAIRASIEASPMPAGGGRFLGPGEFSYAVSAPLYRPGQWRTLAEALELAAKGDGSGLLEIADEYVDRKGSGTYGDSLEVYYGVLSIDLPFPKEMSVYETLTKKLEMDTPRLGAYFPFTALASARWPIASWREAQPIAAEGAPPIVVVGSTSDPATPYEWSVSLAKQLSSGVLLTREGHGHVSFMRGNTCIDTAVTNYLVDLDVPKDAAACN
ncbi:MAG: alpha/beta fold hydrolase [Polyangiaceae bacterium]|nr:alpha/beta fold hydrolase [Polyangiaceae bacterium]